MQESYLHNLVYFILYLHFMLLQHQYWSLYTIDDQLSCNKLRHVTVLVDFCVEQRDVTPDICILRDQFNIFLPPGGETQ